MKKAIITIIVISILIFSSITISFYHAKESAEKYVDSNNYSEHLSEFKGQLVLFINDKFFPCWVFRADYKSELTVGPLNVFVSFFGKALKPDKNLEL